MQARRSEAAAAELHICRQQGLLQGNEMERTSQAKEIRATEAVLEQQVPNLANLSKMNYSHTSVQAEAEWVRHGAQVKEIWAKQAAEALAEEQVSDLANLPKMNCSRTNCAGQGRMGSDSAGQGDLGRASRRGDQGAAGAVGGGRDSSQASKLRSCAELGQQAEIREDDG